MIFFWAFVIGGLICVIGQLMFDVVKLTPAHTMATLVVAGAILDGFNLYEPLIDFAGAGATATYCTVDSNWSRGNCTYYKFR